MPGKHDYNRKMADGYSTGPATKRSWSSSFTQQVWVCRSNAFPFTTSLATYDAIQMKWFRLIFYLHLFTFSGLIITKMTAIVFDIRTSPEVRSAFFLCRPQWIADDIFELSLLKTQRARPAWAAENQALLLHRVWVSTVTLLTIKATLMGFRAATALELAVWRGHDLWKFKINFMCCKQNSDI